MSVTQISKIQVRRGRKLTEVGVPQLSAAEFAWAVDTQELYIGNGSIAEGAPYVGNTKILTEHDNILELASSYRYGSSDITITQSRTRSIQSKLDDTVSVLDFVDANETEVDWAQVFNAALAQLFQHADSKYKKTLLVPAGTYIFTSSIYVPSTARIQGEHTSACILDLGDNDIVFVSSQGTLPADIDSNDTAEDIVLKNLTIRHITGRTEITGTQGARFENVEWVSIYDFTGTNFIEENANAVYVCPGLAAGGFISITSSRLSTTITQPYAGTAAGTMSALVGQLLANQEFTNNFTASIVDPNGSFKITSKFPAEPAAALGAQFTVLFLPSNALGQAVLTVDPVLTEFDYGAKNVHSSVYWENKLFGIRTTNLVFDNCKFNQSELGIECHQSDAFATHVEFRNCDFIDCDQGIFVAGVSGQENLWIINNCRFERCFSSAVNVTSGRGSRITNCDFIECGIGFASSKYPEYPVVKFGELADNSILDSSFDRYQVIDYRTLSEARIPDFVNLARAEFVDQNKESVYLSDSARKLATFPAGQRYIQLNYRLTLGSGSRVGQLVISVDQSNKLATFNDSYSFVGDNASVSGFEFVVTVDDYNSDTVYETLTLSYKNPTSSGDNGSITYSITYYS